MEEKRYWEEVVGFVTENKIDKRWILRSNVDDKAHGSLRIVSHPDLKPGHLRAFLMIITSRKKKSDEEIEKFIEEYKMESTEIEAYSVDEHLEKTDRVYEAPFQELEELFGVNIFPRKKRKNE
jgi:hypothetical protein